MSDETIARDLDELGASLQEQPSVRAEVMKEVTRIALAPPGMLARARRNWPALAALAACVIMALSLIALLAGNSASVAFAAAIDSVAKAHTFSCRQISEFTDKDGKPQRHETICMFKEPNLSRTEMGAGTPGEGQVTITDYGQKLRLTLMPKEKVADLQDTSAYFDVDAATGELKPEQLDTEARDKVLKLTAESVKDMGSAELNGKTVRMLQSNGKESVRTIYVDPRTHQPVEVVIEWPGANRAKYTFADIQIDAPIDDKLFSLDVPAGYKLFNGGPYVPAPDYYARLMTKMRHLSMACIMYANDHKDEYPNDLTDLAAPGGMDVRALHRLLESPDKPNSPPAIIYHKPRPGKPTATEIILYESEAQRRDNKVAAAMKDGHAEILTKERFEQMMK